MRTEVWLSFSGKRVPGGAQDFLSTVGCGPDVTMIQDFTISGTRSIFVYVTLDATDRRLPTLLHRLVQHNVNWLERRRDIYTDEELDRAKLILVFPAIHEAVVAQSMEIETRYELGNACNVCGSGARQASPLMINHQAPRALEGRRAAVVYSSDIIVDERVAEELEGIGAVGLSFRPVYAVMENGRQVKMKWRQLCAARELPPMSPRSTSVARREPCRGCARSGFTRKLEIPVRLAYHANDLARIDDVHTTWEWFGDTRFRDDGTQVLFPYPWFLVSPKVMRVLRAADPAAFEWLAVQEVDD